MEEKTVFKKIIDGEIPAHKVFEDEQHLAFLDIAPVALGHILLIPKKEHTWIQDMPDDELADIFIQAKKLIKTIKEALECDYVQLSVVGKDVPHVHVHLIPRYFDDTIPSAPTTEYKDGEAQEYADKITSAI